LKPGTGAKYAGLDDLAGTAFETDCVTFSDTEGEHATVRLGEPAAARFALAGGDWVLHTGPRGGTYWTKGDSVRYQKTKPGSGGYARRRMRRPVRSKLHHLASTADRAAEAKLKQAADFVAGKFAELSEKHGRRGAVTVMGAAVLAIPLPGPSDTLPQALAQGILKLKASGGATFATAPEIGGDELAAAVKDFLGDFYQAFGEPPPDLSHVETVIDHLQELRQSGDAQTTKFSLADAPAADPVADDLIRRARTAVGRLAGEARAELLAALDTLDGGQALAAARRVLDKYRIRLARMLSDLQLASVLAGLRRAVDRLPHSPRVVSADPLAPVPPETAIALTQARAAPTPEERLAIIQGLPSDQSAWVQQQLGAGGMPPPIDPPWRPAAPAPGDHPDVHFPVIEEAAKAIHAKQVLRREDFDQLDAEAKARAFTVAGIETEATLEKVRDALAETVLEGADLGVFRQKVIGAHGDGLPGWRAVGSVRGA
jgi:hypothetical protein